MEDKYKLLRKHIENIVDITNEEFAFVKENFIFEKYQKNEILFSKGKKVEYVYFVLSGLLKLVYTDDNLKQHIVSFAMEDWWETDFRHIIQREMHLLL